MKKVLLTLAISLSTLGLSTTLLGSGAFAQFDAAKNAACEGVAVTDSNTNCNSGDSSGSLNGILTTALGLLSIVAGVITVIVIIVGGVKFITSQGDASNVSSAKNTVLYALVGLMIVALSQIMVRFVLNKADDGLNQSQRQDATQFENDCRNAGGGPC